VPKDGTEILLWYADMKAVNVAFWDGGHPPG
jgi:prepilin-type processing-associated H-X9-DG protein